MDADGTVPAGPALAADPSSGDGAARGGGGRDGGTARPGGRLKRVAGGRKRAVLVRLSGAEEEWLVPRAAALGISVQRLLVESAMAGGTASVLARRTVFDEFLAARRDVLGVAVNINQLARWGNEQARMPAGVAEALDRFETAQARLTDLAERVVGELTAGRGGPAGSPVDGAPAGGGV